jgi:GWxTD domain-containing protein
MKFQCPPAVAVLFLIIGLLGSFSQGQEKQPGLRQEEAEDYFDKWLKEDVVLIISDEERAVFGKLTTAEEKEQFIEQFWFRRDPNPASQENEFREEHYRRIAYANDTFASGLPGWQTDRGRIYIIHGPPAEIQSHPTGGTYERPMAEGGGSTTTFPYEVWRYRHIEGLGDDIILEFVDQSLAGEYKLARRPEEKDALLYVPGGGRTLAESMGLATKADRPFFSPGNLDMYPMMHYSANDSLFARYERYARIQRPATFKYPDLKELVTVDIAYDTLPLSVREDYFRLNELQVLVPVTLEIENKQLSYIQEGEREVARVGIYGLVTSMTNRVAYEFDDEVLVSSRLEDLEKSRLKNSIYQRIIPVDGKMRYKMDLVVKDLNSSRVGVLRRAINPPPFGTDHLSSSSLLLSNSIRIVEIGQEDVEMFVLGDVKIHPSLAKVFTPAIPMGLYFQLYNAALDEATLSPHLSVTFRVFRNGELVAETTDENGESTRYFSRGRVVILKLLGLAGLETGEYEIRVEAVDLLNEQRLVLSDQFKFVDTETSSALKD